MKDLLTFVIFPTIVAIIGVIFSKEYESIKRLTNEFWQFWKIYLKIWIPFLLAITLIPIVVLSDLSNHQYLGIGLNHILYTLMIMVLSFWFSRVTTNLILERDSFKERIRKVNEALLKGIEEAERYKKEAEETLERSKKRL